MQEVIVSTFTPQDLLDYIQTLANQLHPVQFIEYLERLAIQIEIETESKKNNRVKEDLLIIVNRKILEGYSFYIRQIVGQKKEKFKGLYYKARERLFAIQEQMKSMSYQDAQRIQIMIVQGELSISLICFYDEIHPEISQALYDNAKQIYKWVENQKRNNPHYFGGYDDELYEVFRQKFKAYQYLREPEEIQKEIQKEIPKIKRFIKATHALLMSQSCGYKKLHWVRSELCLYFLGQDLGLLKYQLYVMLMRVFFKQGDYAELERFYKSSREFPEVIKYEQEDKNIASETVLILQFGQILGSSHALSDLVKEVEKIIMSLESLGLVKESLMVGIALFLSRGELLPERRVFYVESLVKKFIAISKDAVSEMDFCVLYPQFSGFIMKFTETLPSMTQDDLRIILNSVNDLIENIEGLLKNLPNKTQDYDRKIGILKDFKENLSQCQSRLIEDQKVKEEFDCKKLASEESVKGLMEEKLTTFYRRRRYKAQPTRATVIANTRETSGNEESAPSPPLLSKESEYMSTHPDYKSAYDAFSKGDLNSAYQILENLTSAQPLKSWDKLAAVELLASIEMIQFGRMYKVDPKAALIQIRKAKANIQFCIPLANEYSEESEDILNGFKIMLGQALEDEDALDHHLEEKKKAKVRRDAELEKSKAVRILDGSWGIKPPGAPDSEKSKEAKKLKKQIPDLDNIIEEAQKSKKETAALLDLITGQTSCRPGSPG